MRQLKGCGAIFYIWVALSVSGCSTFELGQNQHAENKVDVEPVATEWYPLDPTQADRISATTSNIYEQGNTITLEGKPYYLDDSGQLVLGDGELAALKKQGVKVYNPRPIHGIEMDSQELGALMQDEEAFFAFMRNPDYRDPGQVSFVAKKGDLRTNLERLASNHRIQNFRWELDYSFYLPETKVITANSFEELLGTMTRGFPIEAELATEQSGGSVMRVFSIAGVENRISFVVSSGSLKENFERLAVLAGWDDRWEFDHDFHVPDTLVIRGSTYRDVLSKMLKIQKYPIVAEEAR